MMFLMNSCYVCEQCDSIHTSAVASIYCCNESPTELLLDHAIEIDEENGIMYGELEEEEEVARMGVPQWYISLADEIVLIGNQLKVEGGTNRLALGGRLRRLADILEQAV